MKDWFSTSPASLLAICLSGVGIYIIVIIYTRIFGKRSFSKMSAFDFAFTIAVGSVLSTTMLSKTTTLIQGAFGLLVIFVVQFTIAKLRKSKPFQGLIDNSPILLMDGSRFLHENLKKARVTESDIRSKLREANVIELSSIKAVVFESTGDISVLHSNDPAKSIEEELLKGVIN